MIYRWRSDCAALDYRSLQNSDLADTLQQTLLDKGCPLDTLSPGLRVVRLYFSQAVVGLIVSCFALVVVQFVGDPYPAIKRSGHGTDDKIKYKRVQKQGKMKHLQEEPEQKIVLVSDK